ncbi:hypothetical protein PRVXT_000773 [Proteinivorax tanatarense]|uniref:Uncharacterized protein n=1 Tax=Proteinivorax tanatarense TaxID=1260629 RepID=A0AAU7VNV0_9FIRM
MKFNFMVRRLENKHTILVGNYDIVIGLADLAQELGLEVKSIIVKHSMCKKAKECIPQKWK